jgi:RNA polymerase sigma-70 factor (ECF subfamily)
MLGTARVTAADDLRAVFADEGAFRAWYERALPRVYGFVASRCGGPGPLAEELTQQVFVEALRSRRSFDGRSDVVTWLCGIGRHKLADHFRRVERDERRRGHLVVAEIQPARGADAIRATDERDAIERALRTLPSAQRAALIFHHLDGLSVTEVARLLARSETAVESLLARARAGFRAAYEGHHHG